MLCPNCSHENPETARVCRNCGTELAVKSSVSKEDHFGMAKIQIICRPYTPLWYRIMFWAIPWKWKYKFYIDIDGNEYTMISTEKEKEFRVPAGIHNLRIGYMTKNSTSKVMSKIGTVLEYSSLVTGSANTAILGHAMSQSKVDISDYFSMQLDAGQTYTFRLKMNNMLLVREDK